MAAARIQAPQRAFGLSVLYGRVANLRESKGNDPIGSLIPWKFQVAVPSTSVDDIGDRIEILKFPAGSFLEHLTLSGLDCDTATGHSFALVLEDLSQNEQTTKVIATSNAGRDGSAVDLDSIAKGLYVGEQVLVFKTTAAATTPQAGTLTVFFKFSKGVLTDVDRGVRLTSY